MTLKEAVAKSIELWEWLAKTGKDKEDYFKLKEIDGFNRPQCDCYLCESVSVCQNCPLNSCCDDGEPYDNWNRSDTYRDRRKYAQALVDQLKVWQEKHEVKTTLKQ